MPLQAVALAAAAAQGRLLGRLLRLGAPQAAGTLPAYHPRRLRSAVAAASRNGGAGGGGVAAAAAADAPLELELDEELKCGLEASFEDDLEATVLDVLPRKLGIEVEGASRTGAFQRLPMVSPSKELLQSAVRRAERTPYNKKIKNEAQKSKNRCGGTSPGQAARRSIWWHRRAGASSEHCPAVFRRRPATRRTPMPAPRPPQGRARTGHPDEGAVRAAGRLHQGLPPAGAAPPL